MKNDSCKRLCAAGIRKFFSDLVNQSTETRPEIARKIGVKPGVLRNLLDGSTAFSVIRLIDLACALNVNPHAALDAALVEPIPDTPAETREARQKIAHQLALLTPEAVGSVSRIIDAIERESLTHAQKSAP